MAFEVEGDQPPEMATAHDAAFYSDLATIAVPASDILRSFNS